MQNIQSAPRPQSWPISCAKGIANTLKNTACGTLNGVAHGVRVVTMLTGALYYTTFIKIFQIGTDSTNALDTVKALASYAQSCQCQNMLQVPLQKISQQALLNISCVNNTPLDQETAKVGSALVIAAGAIALTTTAGLVYGALSSCSRSGSQSQVPPAVAKTKTA